MKEQLSQEEQARKAVGGIAGPLGESVLKLESAFTGSPWDSGPILKAEAENGGVYGTLPKKPSAVGEEASRLNIY